MKPENNDFKRIFNMNYVLGKIINYAAYIILVASAIILAYLSFVETFKFNFDWKTITIFTLATTLLSWLSWNTFYRKQYEKLMDEDIAQIALDKYSIHSRYYNASKDWTDLELQKAIDEFNEEYTQKWLNWVEKTTGIPIESCTKKITDEHGNIKEIVAVKGIKDLPYKKFKHKILMWRIKTHRYPKSGYKTSMELLSLFSYQDANFNKRNLKADKHFYREHSLSKLITSLLVILAGASLIPEMIQGSYWSAVLKLCLAIGTLLLSVLMGAMNGVRGARLKLSIVEDACADMERWANKKPTISPYNETKDNVSNEPIDKQVIEEEQSEQITMDIFSKLNIPKK